ncbi:MAG: hypothetical protein HN686_13590, partial [Bacteroidetes bacterium]|nr:hypothetical protein [Bacteroidota bacterium]
TLYFCQFSEKTDQTEKEAFSGYIQGHTAGVISGGDVIRIYLAQSLQEYNEGDELPETLLNFRPDIKGTLWYLGDGLIEFQPDERLENGNSYKAEFSLGKLIAIPNELKEFSFDFDVLPLDFTVHQGNVSISGKPDAITVSGRIRSSDYIELNALESYFSLESVYESPKFSIEESGKNSYTYRILDIEQQDERYNIELIWNGRADRIDQKGSQEIVIPGNNDFDLLNVVVEQGVDQHIRMDFSATVDPQQNLEGLIYLSNYSNFRLRKAGNQVFLYPQTRISGEWELNLEAGISNQAGRKLGENQSFTLAMDALPPEVQFLSSGYILPNSEGLFLPFRAVSLKAVDLYVYKVFSNNIPQFLQRNVGNSTYSMSGSIKYVGRPVFRKTIRLDEDPSLNLNQWNTFSFDLGPLLQEDPHALYHTEIRIRKPLALYECENQASDQDLAPFLLPEKFSKEDMEQWKDGDYYYEDLYPNEYNWQERDNPCDVSFYTPDRFVYRNVLATNLGILAKSSDQRNFMVAVTDLITAKEVSNATVEFYNFQQQQIIATTTDPDGLVEINLSEVPYLILAYKDDQRAYLRVDDGSSLSLSNFDVAGEVVQEGVKGFIYGERGVWRPGDTVHLTFALFDKDEVLPDDIPVVFELYNSRGQLAHKTVQSEGNNGFYTFPTATDPEDPTGNWRASIKVGGAEFTKTLRIETVKPNRLKINLDFRQKVLTAYNAGQKFDIKSTWLHGADAANLQAEINVQLYEGKTNFKGYEKYSFNDPIRKFWSTDWYLFDGQLSETGAATIDLNMEINQEAPGMLNAVFTSRVFEKGGDFSTDVYSMPFSPYQRYVGVSVQGVNKPNDPLSTDTLQTVNVSTLDPEGNPVSVNGLVARVYKIAWRWWWSSGQEDLSYYVGARHENLISEKIISTSGGKGNFSFKVDYPEWGRYLLHVEDPAGGHAAGQIVYLDWPSWVNRSGRSNPSGATMLSFSADKESYETGDRAVITFPSMKDSRALLTIESGSKVLRSRWIKGKEDETQVDFAITADMAPNVYASITLIQSHIHEDNDLPIRQYGVLHLKVDDPETILKPEVNLPDEIRPNESYSVEVSEANGTAMTYTLAIVDEGLLDLTRFKTPDPWSVFFAREALGVKTWDVFDDVIGAYGGRMESLLAVGGDEGAMADGAKKANRFQTVVSFLGPFDLKRGKTNTHEIVMPNYVGSVKAMVVAGDSPAWGSAEATAPVRKPLMVLTTLPRVLSPGESLDLPVNLFVMKENLPDAEIRVITEGPVYCSGPSAKEVRITSMGEQMIYFDLKTSAEPGIAKIKVLVEAGDESASYETEIEVRNPNPYTYQSELIVIEPGETADVIVNFHGMRGTNSGTLDIASLPPFNLENNLQYLIKYPYGCVEQTTSGAFVQLYLDQLMELSESSQIKVNNNVQSAIQRLTGFQLPVGGLSFWPGNSNVNLWGSSYAAHFLLEAEQKGYTLPYGMRDKLINYLKKTASQYSGRNDYNGDNDLQQAYRLYILALASEPNQSAMNRLRETDGLSGAAAWRLAAAYALSGRKEVSLAILNNVGDQNTISYRRPGSTFGSALRDRAMMVETLLLTDQEENAYRIIEQISGELQARTWSTQSTAFGLLALAKFAGERGSGDLMKCGIEINGKKEKVQTNKSLHRIELTEDQEGNAYQLSNDGDKKLYVSLLTYGQSEPGSEETAASNLELTIWYRDMGDSPISVTSINQGTSFKAVVRVSNPPLNGRSDNLALSQIFPSGWEILNTRFMGVQQSGEESSYEYRDIRDDRVNTFFSLEPGASAIYVVSLNAAYKGHYYLPAVNCENMYRPDVFAREAGQWVDVK